MKQESYFDRKERDQEAKRLRAAGHTVLCGTLQGQETWKSGMAAFGMPRQQRPGYRFGSVYMLTVL